MRARSLAQIGCAALAIIFCLLVYACKRQDTGLSGKVQKGYSEPSHSGILGRDVGNMKTLERQLYNLGVNARKHDKLTGADMAYSMRRDYPTALLYIGMMIDKDGDPIKEAQKSFNDLMNLPQEKRKIAVMFFVDGYSKKQ